MSYHNNSYRPTEETVPSRRHNQSDSESGKGANEADTEEVPVSPSFLPVTDAVNLNATIVFRAEMDSTL